MTTGESTPARPPSVDALARALSSTTSLPHAVLVDCARQAIRERPGTAAAAAATLVRDMETALMTDVVNGTGVLLHTNLGRAPLAFASSGRATNLELNLGTGERGSRQHAISRLVALATGAEAAVVVNNNAAAVMLVLAALAQGRDVVVSRGESVEIGGGFRVPEVMEQSGARLVDVGTTNRTRLKDYSSAVESNRHDVALVMKVHPSNFSITGFTESTSVHDLSSLTVPVVVDVGSGLLNSDFGWLHGRMSDIPEWLNLEPSVATTIRHGADLVTFSGDKLMGGPQCGIIAGRRDLVEACAAHPLMRALRPGGHTIAMLQRVLLAFIGRTACDEIPFWSMVTTTVGELEARAHAIVDEVGDRAPTVRVGRMQSVVGAGSAPGGTLESAGLVLPGDRRAELRSRSMPVIARTTNDSTHVDLRTVRPEDDAEVARAVTSLFR